MAAVIDASTCEIEAPIFPSPTGQLINGFDGSLHQVPFQAPSYKELPGIERAVTAPINWSLIDMYGYQVARDAASQGVVFGLLLCTLLYLSFAVPPSKRWKPFHISVTLAVLFGTLSMLLTLHHMSLLNAGLYPAYSRLSRDNSRTEYSNEYLALLAVRQIFDFLSRLMAFVSLYIQTMATLPTLRLNQRIIYHALQGSLILGAASSLVARAVFMGIYMRTSRTQDDSIAIRTTRFCTYVVDSIAVCLFCSCALGSVVKTLLMRNHLLIKKDRGLGPSGKASKWYDIALILLSLVLLESLIVPATLVVLSVQRTSVVIGSRYGNFIFPALLACMPFGGLMSGERHEASDNKTPQILSLGAERSASIERLGSDSEHGTEPSKICSLPVVERSGFHRPSATIDRELAAIDAI
jgi:hypothetical protein